MADALWPLRWVYNTLRETNYDRGLLSRTHSVCGVSIRSYELRNMHALDAGPLLERLVDDVESGDVFYDVGANVGTYSLVIGTARPSVTIHCFEPNPRTSRWLRANIQANDLRNRVSAQQRGVSDTVSEMTFHAIGAHRKSSFERTDDVQTAAGGKEVKVPVVTLDSIIGDLPPPDRLKVDVEGHGDAVLRGASDVLQTHEPIVYIEPHGNVDALASRFDTFDYTIERTDGYWVARPNNQ